ncbi:MAG: hypothetical protein HOE48_01420 [Candidatus Latescibacteria bacterium]|nr:hypothetical protein [Candidatus Latescibacterota bacterium]
METRITTDNDQLNQLYPTVKSFLEQDQVTYTIDAETVHGYRSPDCPALWIRDHSDIVRGAKYFAPDMTSAVTHFANTQLGNGSFFDFVTCNMDNENWTKYVRVPVEADVEYRFVKALYQGWQTTGNDEWLAQMLPHAEKAMHYIMTHPWRWHEEHQLVKRALTMDTWDFDYISPDQPWLNFQITDETHWGIFYGDNAGYCEAFGLLAKLYAHLGQDEKASHWKNQAQGIKERANALCWNGRFYTHRIPLDDFRIQGVDENEQLTLSNPMAINRGLSTHDMAVAMLKEYQHRKKTTGAFAEWFSLDPPYPDGCFGDPKLIGGAYINGGIFPLSGGELARAAFEHGFESYGVQILTQYANMIAESGETYLWYFPDGSPSSEETSTSPEATATDGWGSSAMLYAFVEGLAGVVDTDHLFKKIRLSPRWTAADIKQADVSVAYGPSDAGIQYTYAQHQDKLSLSITGHSHVDLHTLLPQGHQASAVTHNGHPLNFKHDTVENSTYVDASFECQSTANIEITLSNI